jgi:hypothetical protein
MIRELRLTDVPLQLLPGRLAAQDLAITRDDIPGDPHRLSPFQLARWSIASRKHQHRLVFARNGRLGALVVLRPRRGPKSWEIAHLFAVPGADTVITDLLESAVGFVASQRGERLFLRVPLEGGVQRLAERSGFRKAYTEDVFTLPRPMSADLHGSSLNVRPSLPSDAYDIFRLYNATFPAAARAVIALTLDQWQDGYERGRGHVREYVWIHEDQLRGWFRIDQHNSSVIVDAILHPDESARVSLLASYVAQLAWGHQQSTWIVPDHQPELARILDERGWQHSTSYAVMARVVATPVDEPGLAAARA